MKVPDIVPGTGISFPINPFALTMFTVAKVASMVENRESSAKGSPGQLLLMIAQSGIRLAKIQLAGHDQEDLPSPKAEHKRARIYRSLAAIFREVPVWIELHGVRIHGFLIPHRP